MNPLSFLLICFAGWMNRRQQAVIEYLQEEVRVLQEQLGKRPHFTEDQRRRLAAKGKPMGRKGLLRFASLVTPDCGWQKVRRSGEVTTGAREVERKCARMAR